MRTIPARQLEHARLTAGTLAQRGRKFFLAGFRDGYEAGYLQAMMDASRLIDRKTVEADARAERLRGRQDDPTPGESPEEYSERLRATMLDSDDGDSQDVPRSTLYPTD